MKRQDLLLITFLLSQTTPVWAMWGSDDSQSGDFSRTQTITKKKKTLVCQSSSDQAQTLRESISKGIAITEKILGHNLREPKVVVMGPTGSGKSALVNLLADRLLDVNEDLKIDVKNPVPGSEIGHGIMSQTALPSLCMGPDHTFLCDLPGDFDTGGPAKNIENLAMTHTVLLAPVKILLTVPEENLAGKKTAFLEQINSMTKIYPCAQLKNGLSLVITKQGSNRTVNNPHTVLKTLLTGHSQADNIHLMTEDVRSLLTHLTEEENIRTRVLYFPFPDEPGSYKHTEAVKTNVLESIQLLKSMKNSHLKIELPPESSLLVTKLAKDLNKNIESSIKELSPKILHLCRYQTTAYASNGSMEGLESNVRTLRKALCLLRDDLPDSMMQFANSFDAYFSYGEDNVLKENVKTLIFLKSLMNRDITYSTKIWSDALQPILDDISKLIDTLADKLYLKVTRCSEVINLSVMQCHTTLPESNDEQGYIEKLTQKLRAIKEAAPLLQSATLENMNDFLSPLKVFFTESDALSYLGSINDSIGFLRKLNDLKETSYSSREMAVSHLNASADYLQNVIATQQALFDLRQRQQNLIIDRQRLEESLEQQHNLTEAEAAAKRRLLEELEDERQRGAEEHRRLTEALEQQQRLAVAAEQQFQQDIEIERQRAADERRHQLELVATERADWRQQLDAKHQQHLVDQKTIHETEQQRQALAKKIAKKEREIEEIKAQGIVQQETAAQELAVVTQEKQNLNQQLATLTREAERRGLEDQATIRETEERRQGLVREIERKDREIEELRVQADAQQQEAAQQLEQAIQTSQRLTQQLEQATQGADRRRLEDQATIREIEERRQGLAREIEQIRIQSIEQQQAAAQQLEQASQNSQRLTQQLEQATQGADRRGLEDQATIREIEERRQGLTREIEQIRLQFAEQQQAAAQEIEQATQGAERRRLEDQATIREIEERRQGLAREIEQMRAQGIAQQEAAAQELEQATQTSQRLTQQMQGLTQQVAAVTRERQAIEEQRQDLANQVVGKDREIEQIRDQAAAQQKIVVRELVVANDARQVLKDQLVLVEEEKKQLTQQLAAVTEEKNGVVQDLTEANRARKTLLDQLNTFVREKEEVEEKRQALAIDNDRQKKEIEKIEKRVAHEKDQGTIHAREIAETNRINTNLMQQLTVMTQQNQTLTQQLTTANQVIARDAEQLRLFNIPSGTEISEADYNLLPPTHRYIKKTLPRQQKLGAPKTTRGSTIVYYKK